MRRSHLLFYGFLGNDTQVIPYNIYFDHNSLAAIANQ